MLYLSRAIVFSFIAIFSNPTYAMKLTTYARFKCDKNPEIVEAVNKRISEHSKYILEMSARLEKVLEDQHAQVAIVGRAGTFFQDKQFNQPVTYPNGYRNHEGFPSHKYSHVGIAVRADDSENSIWHVYHLLNEADCGEYTENSSIFKQNFGYFFMDLPYLYDTMVTVPSVEMQKRIRDIVLNRKIAMSLHREKYSMLAHPLSDKYQNSNQWVLAVVAKAQARSLQSLHDLQYLTYNKGFKPSEVQLGFFEKNMASWFLANFKADDHRESEKSSGWFQFVSAGSVFDYLSKNTSPILNQKEICLKIGCNWRVDILN